MGCTPLPGGMGWVCTRGGTERKCSSCGTSTRAGVLCDYPLAGPKVGKTCDRFCCRTCATRVGPDRDHCPAHARVVAEKGT